MAIGQYYEGNSTGKFAPRINCDARTGMLSKINRKETEDGWVNVPEQLTVPFNLLMDFANIEITWQCLDRAVGVDVQAVKYRDLIDGTAEMMARPSEHHKQGFRIKVYSTKIDGGVHEFSSTAMCVRQAIDKLHDAYLADCDNHTDESPVIAFSGVTPSSTPRGTNYAPTMEIVGWSSRDPFDAAVAQEAPPAEKSSPVASVQADF